MQENDNNNNNIFPIIVVLIIVLLLVGGAYWYSQNDDMFQISDKTEEVITDQQDVDVIDEQTEEIDEFGEEIIVSLTDEEIDEIRNLFAVKYDKDLESVLIEISKQLPGYVSGVVRFEGEITGAGFYAAKVDENWVLVFDGNGTVACLGLEPYDFPSEIVSECWDEETMQLIKRTDPVEVPAEEIPVETPEE